MTEILNCTGCGKPCTHGYFMCEETDGQWCSGECFEAVRCYELHGEGCSTAVFIGDGLPPPEQIAAAIEKEREGE